MIKQQILKGPTDGFESTAPVGSFPPNAFGLFDMHGMSGEWCGDGYNSNYYRQSPVDDPQGSSDASSRGDPWREFSTYGRILAVGNARWVPATHVWF